MNDLWTDRLSEYLDGDLPETERLEIERHLENCSSCRTTLAELKEVIARAQRLDSVPPGRDLWPAVARSASRPSRHLSISFVELLAAGVLIALVSGLTVWVVTGRAGISQLPQARESAGVVPVSAGGTYDRAVAELLQSLYEGRKQLSPRTINVMERSLTTIDRAIAEASAALEQDPGNVFLSLHIARERQRKLALLRQVQALAERE
jgi:hypothetical protein